MTSFVNSSTSWGINPSCRQIKPFKVTYFCSKSLTRNLNQRSNLGLTQLSCHCPRCPFDMTKFKVEFSNNTTIVAERGLDFPNVAAARKGAREIAKELRADGMLTFGFSDWKMTVMNEGGKAVAEFPLEEHDEA
jgi:hypothetical protein